MEGSLNLLVVDDDKMSVLILTKLLQSYGEVTVCYDGQSAIDTYAQKYEQLFLGSAPYAYIFLDIHMAKVTGIDVLMAIREYEDEMAIKTKAYIVMVTSDKSVDLEAISFCKLCDDYIVKPVTLRLLKAILNDTT
jgi:CheY-like chemotaxis protein